VKREEGMAMAVFRHSLRTVAESRVNQMIGTAVASYHKNVGCVSTLF